MGLPQMNKKIDHQIYSDKIARQRCIVKLVQCMFHSSLLIKYQHSDQHPTLIHKWYLIV